MTTPRLAPRLNRIFSVTGSSTRTFTGPIRWGFNERLLQGFTAAAGQWWATRPTPNFNERVPADVVTAAAFKSATFVELYQVGVNPDGSQSASPNLRTTLSLADRGSWIRFTTPDAGESYLEGNVTFFRAAAADVSVGFSGALTLHGDDFAMAPDDYIEVMFERHTAEQTVETMVNQKVWGELTERGSALGVIDITTDPMASVTGSQEEGSAIIRYDPGLAIGTGLVDDLARAWTIRGSRTLQDRRYLEYDLVRMVTGLAPGG